MTDLWLPDGSGLELPGDLQVKLLRALETRKVQRVGADGLSDTDVRVVAATHRRPQQAVEAHLLREDLLYRLLVFPSSFPSWPTARATSV